MWETLHRSLVALSARVEAIPPFVSFLIEQIFLGVYSLFLFFIFLQQISNEKNDTSLNKKWRGPLHRTGLMASILLGAVAVDPYGFHGIYPAPVTPWIIDNITCLCLASFVFFNQNYVEAAYRTRMEPPGAWIKPSSWFAIISLFLVCNAAHIVAYQLQQYWITCFFLFWVSLTSIVVFIIYGIATFVLTQALDFLDKDNPNGGLHPSKSAADKSSEDRKTSIRLKAVLVIIVGLGITGVATYQGIQVLQDRSAKQIKTSSDHFEPFEHLLLYFECLFLLWLLFVAWFRSPETYTSVEQDHDHHDERSEWRESDRKRFMEQSALSQSNTASSRALSTKPSSIRKGDFSVVESPRLDEDKEY